MPVARKAPPPPPPPPIADAPPLSGVGEGIPTPEQRDRSPKMRKLQASVAGVYIMGGGVLSTLPEQMGGTRVKLIGMSVARSSDEIAEAWIDLAEDDKRVLKMLESLTSFSGWGKVIGVHLMAIGASVPGVAAVMPGPQREPQPQQQGNGMGEDLAAQMVMAELFRMAQSGTRAEAQAPMFQEQAPPPPVQQPLQPQEQAPRVRAEQPTRPGRNAGIPSPADLGVSVPDAPMDFPTAGSENIRG